jgi:hypothetical protein
MSVKFYTFKVPKVFCKLVALMFRVNSGPNE